MKNINIKLKYYTSTVLDLNIIDINKYNFYTILGNVYQKLNEVNPEFYYETNINYQKGDLIRLAIFKTKGEHYTIKLYKVKLSDRKYITNIAVIEVVYIHQLHKFIEDILQGNNTELSIGSDKLSVIIEPIDNKPILERGIH